MALRDGRIFLLLCLVLVASIASSGQSFSQVTKSTIVPHVPRPLPGGCACQTLIAEEEGCCRPGDGGEPFPMTPCNCRTCFKGEFTEGVCPPRLTCANTLCSAGTTCCETPNGPKCEAVKPADCACTKIFRPVCCQKPDGAKETASSDCLCSCGGGKVVSNGVCAAGTCATVKCVAGQTCFETPGGPKCQRDKPDRCICPAVVQPICCQERDGTKKTAGNACECSCRGGKLASEGECPSITCANVRCKGPGPCVDTPKGPVCSESKPSCATVKCSAGQTCVETPKGPKCQHKPAACSCPKTLQPVCCQQPDGTQKTACNACKCGCEGGKVAFEISGKVASGIKCPSKTCANVRCKGPGPCIDTPEGPVCSDKAPTNGKPYENKQVARFGVTAFDS
jgi:hypothetical protein